MIPLHKEKINEKVVRVTWDNLSHEIRDIIANDSLHLSETFKWFTAHCEAETNRLFNDPDFYYNYPVHWENKR